MTATENISNLNHTASMFHEGG